LFEFMETGQAAAEHGEEGRREYVGGNPRPATRILHPQLPLGAEAEELFSVSQQSS
jgi:hypothetical protein